MISDKAMLICLHITMWTARKHDKRVSEEVAQSHEANTNAGRYNKHLLDQAEKLEELRTLAGQIRQYFYKVTLPWSDEGYRLLPSHLYFEFTNQMSEFKTAYEQLVREFLDAYPTYREQARSSLGLLYRDSDYPDWSKLTEKFDLTTDILPIPCGEDFRVTLGAGGEGSRRPRDRSASEAVPHARHISSCGRVSCRRSPTSPRNWSGRRPVCIRLLSAT